MPLRGPARIFDPFARLDTTIDLFGKDETPISFEAPNGLDDPPSTTASWPSKTSGYCTPGQYLKSRRGEPG